MSHHDKLLRIEAVLPGVLSQELVGATNVGKGIGPASTFIGDAAILDVCGRYSFGRESGAEVASVFQAVLGAPEASVDVDDCWVGAF